MSAMSSRRPSFNYPSATSVSSSSFTRGLEPIMDSMDPDPQPITPSTLPEIRAQVARLEAAHRAKGLHLSGRVIHVCHHLPVEIVKTMPSEAQLESSILTPPMTPEFKPEDEEMTIESKDAKWRIHARTAHPAMVSGIKSLSDSHEQLIVAWTGDVLLQPNSQPTPRMADTATLPSLSSLASKLLPSENGNGTARVTDPAQPTAPQEQEKQYMVYGVEFSEQEKQEMIGELKRFSDIEAEKDGRPKINYVPVFLPPDVSKGHYEGFCKKSTSTACCITRFIRSLQS